jgi:hypothetical protein
MTRFADLGMPFPLFEAEVQEASGYRGFDTCFLCQREHVHCFKPDAVLIVCPSCATENELDVASSAASYYVGGVCMHCSSPLPSGKGLVCYSCLRAGRAWFTKMTELGLVRRQEALAGRTFGFEGLDRHGFDLVTQEGEEWVAAQAPSAPPLEGPGFVLLPQEERWVAARVPSEHLMELILTPTYMTWQGADWLFCCRAPMIYIGSWEKATFTERAPDGNGHAFFDEILQLPQKDGDGLWKSGFGGCSVYVFRCPRCGTLRGNFDCD